MCRELSERGGEKCSHSVSRCAKSAWLPLLGSSTQTVSASPRSPDSCTQLSRLSTHNAPWQPNGLPLWRRIGCSGLASGTLGAVGSAELFVVPDATEPFNAVAHEAIAGRYPSLLAVVLVTGPLVTPLSSLPDSRGRSLCIVHIPLSVVRGPSFAFIGVSDGYSLCLGAAPASGV